MREYIEERVKKIALYIIENQATVRGAAKHFSVSKSTVHKDMDIRLYEIDRSMQGKVKKILEKNKSERHLRGGQATKQKYKLINNSL